jgi:hypothetical protein
VSGRDKPDAAAKPYRYVAFAIAILFVVLGVDAVALTYNGNGSTPDFLSFWAAGRLAIRGDAALAYDIIRHHAVELQGVTNAPHLPFPYPPPFLLFVAPFGVAPFWLAFGAWVALGAALYTVCVRGLLEIRFALAQAAAGVNLVIGQNGFLTAAIFIAGTALLSTQPFVAGAILGLLVIKPQLAVLLAVAVIAGRNWRALAGGAVSSIMMGTLSLLLFGPAAYRGFVGILPHYAQLMTDARWPWGELASAFALLRLFGLPQGPALAIHTLIAIVAAAATWRAWALKLDERVPILAAATLLIPPYLFTYDALLLTVPLAWLLQHRAPHWQLLSLWALSLFPIVSYFTQLPNTVPLAAIFCLWLLHRPGSRDSAHQV